jgi:predicted RecB family nuclease
MVFCNPQSGLHVVFKCCTNNHWDMKITNDIIESYFDCKLKSYLKRQGEQGEISQIESHYRAKLQRYRARVYQNKFATSFTTEFTQIQSLSVFKNTDILYNVRVTSKRFDFCCDAIKTKRAQGKLTLIPILVIPNESIELKYKVLISFIAMEINQHLHCSIEFAEIIYSEKMTSTKVYVRHYSKHVNATSLSLEDQASPFFCLNAHCSLCQFQTNCRERAKASDHLSLLRGIGAEKIKKLNRKGIFTTNQLSYTFRPKRKSEKVDNRSKVRSFELQALAVREQKIFTYDLPERFPESETEVFLDVESLPDFNFYYLIGITVKIGKSLSHEYFWSDSRNDEQASMEKLISRLSILGNYQIYHYGSFEIEFLKTMQKRLGESYKLATTNILSRCYNVLSLLYNSIYFPSYSNSLKDIARCINFKWSEDGATGLHSLYWREMWEASKASLFKEKLITYNKEDCNALVKLKDALNDIIANNKIDQIEVSKVRDLVSTRRAMFVVNSSFFPEIKYINKCAYFDYQKERVHARVKKRKANTQVIQQNKKYFFNCKPTKTIAVETDRCESCHCKKITPIKSRHRKVVDLVFTSTGVRRVIIQYLSSEYQCKKCNTSFVPSGYPPHRLRLGHKLIVWVIFQHFENSQSFRMIVKNFWELFHLYFSKTTFFACKGYFMKFYGTTYQDILNNVKTSKILYVDETPFSLNLNKGYVWVITNGNEVVSIYQPNREASFIKEFLKDFTGVLVTDFYSGYDSLNCDQQKCLIHLIRDMNTDLVRNPFNDEFKTMSKMFTVLLKGIVETIDRFGLKRYYLKKYMKDVVSFFSTIERGVFRTEIAIKYQNRFLKNRNKLFEFINHDNVSWNNNNAEHAIKILAMHANKDLNGFRETRIDDYLKIMSIYQSCKFQNISFLKYLLSTEDTLEAYVSKNRRHTNLD